MPKSAGEMGSKAMEALKGKHDVPISTDAISVPTGVPSPQKAMEELMAKHSSTIMDQIMEHIDKKNANYSRAS